MRTITDEYNMTGEAKPHTNHHEITLEAVVWNEIKVKEMSLTDEKGRKAYYGVTQ